MLIQESPFFCQIFTSPKYTADTSKREKCREEWGKWHSGRMQYKGWMGSGREGQQPNLQTMSNPGRTGERNGIQHYQFAMHGGIWTGKCEAIKDAQTAVEMWEKMKINLLFDSEILRGTNVACRYAPAMPFLMERFAIYRMSYSHSNRKKWNVIMKDTKRQL